MAIPEAVQELLAIVERLSAFSFSDRREASGQGV